MRVCMHEWVHALRINIKTLKFVRIIRDVSRVWLKIMKYGTITLFTPFWILKISLHNKYPFTCSKWLIYSPMKWTLCLSRALTKNKITFDTTYLIFTIIITIAPSYSVCSINIWGACMDRDTFIYTCSCIFDGGYTMCPPKTSFNYSKYIMN